MRIGCWAWAPLARAFYEIVAKRADMEIARVLDLRPIPGLGGKLTTRFEDILEDKSIDTVVELMAGWNRRTSSWCGRCAPARVWSRPTS